MLNIKNRYIKNILFKSISEAGIGVLDVIDIDDMNIKLGAFGELVALAVVEITDDGKNAVGDVVIRLKTAYPAVPVMAIVYKDTHDIVSFAMKLGINDILFLPKNTDTYREAIQRRMADYYEQMNKPKQEAPLSEMIYENINVREALSLELSRAVRGEYSLSIIMAYLNGHGSEVVQNIINTIKEFIRNTDKILLMDSNTFITIFPFVEKTYVPILEEKFREAFKNEIKRVGIHKKLCLYSATFPEDGDTLEILLERLEKGINNSIVINSVRTPLNSLSQSDIEHYKKKLKQYKRFF